MSKAALLKAKLAKSIAAGGASFSLGTVDTVYYDQTGTAATLGETNATRTSNDYVVGNSRDNSLNGGRGDDLLQGGLGGDTLNGGAGFDAAVYTGSTTGLTINLANAALNTGEARGDVYNSIEDVIGTQYGDRITGNNDGNVLAGLNGDDTIEGGLGADLLDGGNGNDILIGELSALPLDTDIEVMKGGAGNDVFIAGTRAEFIDGGSNDVDFADAVSYLTSFAGVTVNLTTGRGSGGLAQGDTYAGIESVEGSRHADRITGSGGNDVIIGAGGNDVLRGNGGDDTFLFDLTRTSGPEGSGISRPPSIGNVTIEDMLPRDTPTDDTFDRVSFIGAGITRDMLEAGLDVAQVGANTVVTSDSLFIGSITLLNFDADTLFFF